MSCGKPYANLIANLFAATEKKIGDTVRDNSNFKLQVKLLSSENKVAHDEVEVLKKESEALRKLVAKYEVSFKSWQTLEDENKTLKTTISGKEKEFKANMENKCKRLSREKESALEEASSSIAELKEELSRVNNENKVLRNEVDHAKQRHSQALAEVKLEYEQKIVMMQCDSKQGNSRLASEEHSRLYNSFQKKMEHLSNEYEQKISGLRQEVETLRRNASSSKEPATKPLSSAKRLGMGSRPPKQPPAPIPIHLPTPPTLPLHMGNRVPPAKKPNLIGPNGRRISLVEQSDNDSD